MEEKDIKLVLQTHKARNITNIEHWNKIVYMKWNPNWRASKVKLFILVERYLSYWILVYPSMNKVTYVSLCENVISILEDFYKNLSKYLDCRGRATGARLPQTLLSNI